MKYLIYISCIILIYMGSDNSYGQHMSSPPGNSPGMRMAENVGEPLQYRCIGPSRGGRVTAVAGVPQRENLFFMGATGGGLWKSDDYGYSWKCVSDGYFPTPSIGAIAVSQSNPEIIYVGTGSDGIRSNVIVGKGMFKSSDEGNTWAFCGLKNAGQIGSVIIHPENPDNVYAAVMGQPFRKSDERGVYHTADGGKTWNNILFLSDSVGAVDLEFAPGNPDIIYAAMWRAERKPWTIISGGAEDGIYKTTDGGKTWHKKNEGLPTGLVGKIDFAVSTDKPERVWALIQASDDQEGLYRSDDYGESWSKVEMPEATHKSIMYRPFYFINLTANPLDADNIWSGTKTFWESDDGGISWKTVPTTHSDHHDLWINPNNPDVMIEGNDGGASVTRDGGQNWSTVFNQPTAELYSCDVDDQYPYYLYSGQQDNTTIRVPSSQPFLNVLTSNDNHKLDEIIYWERLGGCETGPVVPKPGDPNIVYSNCKGQFSIYNKELGVEHLYYVGGESLYGNHPSDITYRFQRVTPIEVSPHNPEIVYYGSQFIHKTSNGGITWEVISPDLTANEPEYRMRSGGPIDEDISGEEYYNVLYAIEESPLKEGVIWSGSNDGLFYVTRDGGNTWNNITPDMPEGGRVSNIEASPHDPGAAYYAVYRDYLGDDSPYIFFTGDYGKTWSQLSGGSNGIPGDYPVRVVREDPKRKGLLYAGTEFGIFISFNNGESWLSFQRNLPVVPVTDIRIIRDDLALSTLGRSFWILDDISFLRDFDPENNQSRLFKPRDTHISEQRIHFILPGNEPEMTVSLDVKKDNKTVYSTQRRISSIPCDEWGVYRIDWDKHHYIPYNEGTFKGPLVAPGKYKAVLNYGNLHYEQEFNHIISPELEDFGVHADDLVKQEELALKIAELIIQVKQEISDLEMKLEKTDNKSARERINRKLSLLQKGKRRYDKPMLIDHIEYLYEMVTSVPQKLGEDAFTRYNELKSEWGKLLSDL